MKNFAVVVNGVVENCIVAESIEIAQQVTGKDCVEYTMEDGASIGFLYASGVFTNPNPQIIIEEEPADLVPPIGGE